jgi:adenine deaminase
MRSLCLVIVLSLFNCVHRPESGLSPSNQGEKNASASASNTLGETVTFFHNVRVFDGQQVWPKVNVVLAQGRIAALGVDLPQPPGAAVVEGTGKTLLPGFIDAHAHVWNQAQLEQASMRM